MAAQPTSPSFLLSGPPPANNPCLPPPNRSRSGPAGCSTGPTIDQMIEDTIFKVTAQSLPHPPLPDPSLVFHSHPSHSQPFDFAPQPYGLPQWPSHPPLTQPMGPFPDHPIGPPLQPSSLQPHQPAPASQNALPPDILHILESDFTSGAPDGPDKKAAEINRVAEELRIKVRLSRYRRARDELSESGEDGGATSAGGCSSASEDEGLEEGEEKADALDEVDGSGDEEEELLKSNQALLKLKMEIEQIIGVPEHPAQPLVGPDTASATESKTDGKENELVMQSTDLVSLAPRSEELKLDAKVESALTVTAPAEPESQEKPALANFTVDSLSFCSQDHAMTDAVQIGSTAQAELGQDPKEVIVNNPTVKPEELAKDLSSLSFPEQQGTTTPANMLTNLSAPKQSETLTGDLLEPTFYNQSVKNVGEVEVDRLPLVELSKELAPGDSYGASQFRKPESGSLLVQAPLDQSDKCAAENELIASTVVTQVLASNPLQVLEVVDPETSHAEDEKAKPVSQSGNQRRRQNRAAKMRSQVEEELEITSEDDCSQSDDDLASVCGGPTTANELKEPPPDTTEVPFEKLSEDELESIRPFGTVTAVISNVLVIKGTAGLGYDKVLDEGSLVCFQDGLVIGKVFETFGSVTDPHYSIHLPAHLSSLSAPACPSSGSLVYFVPSHSSFVFTSALKAQPKGTDASNLYDEEVGQTDEIEFSDDEAEAAYVRSCRLAKKAAAAARRAAGTSGARCHGGAPRAEPVLVSEDGRRMLTKRVVGELNYDDEDGAGPGSTDYSLLERPKGGLDYGAAGASHHEPCGSASASSDKRGQSRRGRGGRGASRGRDRGRRKSQTGLQRSGTPGKPRRDAHSAPPLPAFAPGKPAVSFPVGGQSGFVAPGAAIGPGPVGGVGLGGVLGAGSGGYGPMGGQGPYAFGGTTMGGAHGGGYHQPSVGYPHHVSPFNFCYQPGQVNGIQQLNNYHHQNGNSSLAIGPAGFGYLGPQQQQQQQRGGSGGSGAGAGGGGVYNPRFFGW